MNKSKIIIVASLTIVAGLSTFLGIANFSKANAHASTSDVTLANIDAFMSVQSLDCEYVRIPFECSIYVGVKGKIKLLGGSILEAGADGYITFDGGLTCEADGKQTCTPTECKELYEIILNNNELHNEN